MQPDTVATVVQQTSESFGIEMAKVAVFAIFITAIVEVIKGVSAKGLFGTVKELALSLIKQTTLSVDTMKTLNFIVALIYLRVFEYGVMIRLLRVQIDSNFAWWLDYIGTASLIYMGADWAFMQWKKLKTNLQNGTKT